MKGTVARVRAGKQILISGSPLRQIKPILPGKAMQMPVRIIQSMRAPSPFMKSIPDVIMSAISDPKIPVLIHFELLANHPINYTISIHVSG